MFFVWMLDMYERIEARESADAGFQSAIQGGGEASRQEKNGSPSFGERLQKKKQKLKCRLQHFIHTLKNSKTIKLRKMFSSKRLLTNFVLV